MTKMIAQMRVLSPSTATMRPGTGGITSAATERSFTNRPAVKHHKREKMGKQKSGIQVLAEMHAREYIKKKNKQVDFTISSRNSNSRQGMSTRFESNTRPESRQDEPHRRNISSANNYTCASACLPNHPTPPLPKPASSMSMRPTHINKPQLAR